MVVGIRALSLPPGDTFPMTDLLWLAILAGLFLLTLAFARLCEKA
jgi:hypothetical protein